MNHDLVLEVVPDIVDEELKARRDELLIIGIINLALVCAILNEEQGECFNLECAQKSLVFIISLCFFFVVVVKNEVFLGHIYDFTTSTKSCSVGLLHGDIGLAVDTVLP